MKNNTLDLHGAYTQDAKPKIQEMIMDLEDLRVSEVEIITGKGSGALQTTLEDFIRNYNKTHKIKLVYKTINQGGSYLIYLEQQDRFSYDEYHYYNAIKKRISDDFDKMVSEFKK
ncbi:Smr/MutS family protein [Mycoplasma sp. 394]